ncbi:helix-turn-helix transcriptional regulator [Streptomyces sp. NPDC005989]|uniref:helix-turn-helix domain-containing protein n=1 Tax=Streptomyces sp. NPDC005989 TaxID=3156727 RepID=UPI0033EC74E1
MNQDRCLVVEDGEDCTKPAKRRKMCDMHYRRWRLYGDATVTRIRRMGKLQALVRQAAEAETDDCVIITGHKRRPTARIDGQTMNASRAVWIITHGDPGNRAVLHTCHRGMEGCVNKRHLYLGDQAQNLRDMDEAGRRITPDRRGEANGRHKLTDRKAAEIRRQYAAGDVRQVDLAKQHGVSQAVISAITLSKRWVPEGQHRRTATLRRRPTAEQITAIREAWKQGGVSQQALADRFGFGQSTISRIVNGT